MIPADRMSYLSSLRRAALALTALVLTFAFDDLEAFQDLVLLLYWMLFSLEVAFRVRPSLRTVFRRERSPGIGDVLALLPGFLLALPTLGLFGWAASVVAVAAAPASWTPQRFIEHVLIGFGLAVCAGPSLIALFRARAADLGPWPFVLGVLSAAVFCCAGGVVWLIVRQTFFQGPSGVEDIGTLAACSPPLGLALGATGWVWWRAAAMLGGRPFDLAGLLSVGLWGARLGLISAFAIACVLLSTAVGGLETRLNLFGLACSLVYGSLLGGVWMLAFDRLGRLAEDNWASATFSLIVLCPLLLISLVPFGTLWTLPPGWAQLVAVMLLPVALVDAVLIMGAAQGLILLSRRAHRFTVWTPPHPGSTG